MELPGFTIFPKNEKSLLDVDGGQTDLEKSWISDFIVASMACMSGYFTPYKHHGSIEEAALLLLRPPTPCFRPNLYDVVIIIKGNTWSIAYRDRHRYDRP
jgi:hypothetical protein